MLEITRQTGARLEFVFPSGDGIAISLPNIPENVKAEIIQLLEILDAAGTAWLKGKK